MASKRLRRLSEEQWHECFYCERETWLAGREGRQAARVRLGIFPGVRGGKTALNHLMATIKHLVREADGGRITDENTVMACSGCNSMRDDRTVEEHKRLMMRLHWGVHAAATPKYGRWFRKVFKAIEQETEGATA